MNCCQHRPAGAAGVPLRALAVALRSAGLAVREGALRLVAQRPDFDTTLEVLPPAATEDGGAQVLAALKISSPVPPARTIPLSSATARNALNRHATLGSLLVDGSLPCIGSRVTIYEHVGAWELLAPLVIASVIHGAPAMLAPEQGAGRGRPRAPGEGSAWTAADFTQAERLLSRLAVCAAGARDFTAEFALRVEASGARAGSRARALWRLRADAVHGAAGAGLGCRLELPHAFDEEAEALQAAERLNALEMTARNLPPHFGAWCAEGTRLLYVSFVPNELRPLAGLTVNLSVWARARALWAQRQLRARRRPR